MLMEEALDPNRWPRPERERPRRSHFDRLRNLRVQEGRHIERLYATKVSKKSVK